FSKIGLEITPGDHRLFSAIFTNMSPGKKGALLNSYLHDRSGTNYYSVILMLYANMKGIHTIPIDPENRHNIEERIRSRTNRTGKFGILADIASLGITSEIRKLRTNIRSLQAVSSLGDIGFIEDIHRNKLNSKGCAIIVGEDHLKRIAQYVPAFRPFPIAGTRLRNLSTLITHTKKANKFVENRLKRKRLI
ncbi:MAG: hypothetical protein Q7K42_06360, partial [Candidatus Diapherotrites archaeon]|nr:hypothetical protein [Candidatus Diapherotrites archaeon]